MNTHKKIVLSASIFFVCAMLLTFITACVSSTPNPSNPSQSLYQVNPQLAVTSSNIENGVAMAAQVGGSLYPPAAPILGGAVTATNAILGLIALVSAGIAKYKNDQATAHTNAAAALASVVASTPTMIQQAIVAGSSNGSASIVQQHLSDAAKPV